MRRAGAVLFYLAAAATAQDPELDRLIRKLDPDIQGAAVEVKLDALRRAGRDLQLELADSVAELLHSSDPRVVAVARNVLRGLGEDALPAIVRTGVRTDDATIHAGLLAPYGVRAVPHLLDHLHLLSMRPRGACVDVLLQHPGVAVPKLERVLRGASLDARHAARILARFGPTASRTLPALRELARRETGAGPHLAAGAAAAAIARITTDPDERRRVLLEAAGRAFVHDEFLMEEIGRLGPEGRPAAPALWRLMEAEGPSPACLAALWSVEGDAERVLPWAVRAITAATRDHIDDPLGEGRERQDAYAGLLASLGEAARPASGALLEVLARRGPGKDAAPLLEALDATGVDPGLVPRLRSWLRARNDAACHAALQGLGRLGADAAPALAEMRRAFHESGGRARVSALRAWGRMGPEAADAMPEVLSALEHGTAEERDCAFSALCNLGVRRAEALPQLRDALPDEPDAASLWPARFLVVAGGEADRRAGLRYLGACLDRDDLRADALWAVADVDPHGQAFADRVRSWMDARDLRVRAAAALVLAGSKRDAQRALDALASVLRSGPSRGLLDACRAIRRMGPAAAALRDVLADLADDAALGPEETRAVERALAALDG